MNKLDGFEKMIKGSLEDFELPFDSAMWSQMERSLGDSSNSSDHLDAFEKKVKESGEAVEVPYDHKQWIRLDQSLRPSGGMPIKWLAVASFAGLIGSGVLLYSIYGTEEKTPDDVHSSGLVQNTAKTDGKKENLFGDSSFTNQEYTVVSPESKKEIQAICDKVKEKEKENKNRVHVEAIPDPEENKEIEGTKENPTTLVEEIAVKVPEETNINTDVQSGEEQKNNIKLPSPVMQIMSEEYCSGQEVEFTASNIPENCVCQWEINKNGLPLRTNNLTYYFAEPGNYTISLQFVSGTNTSVVTEKSIVVKPSPQITFDWTEEVINGKPYVHFRNNSHDIVSSKWIFNNGSTSVEKDPVRFFRYKGEYQVGLTATGSNGCQSKAIHTVRVEKEYNLFAPNAFTPNGDNTNNTFIPEALKVMDVEFTMTIYTRDQKLVYQTKSVDSPWDGRFMSDNQAAPEGTYVWIVNIPGEEPYMGYVTIVK